MGFSAPLGRVLTLRVVLSDLVVSIFVSVGYFLNNSLNNSNIYSLKVRMLEIELYLV